MSSLEIRTVNVVQYMQPLREGGSLPAIVKADDDFMYVLKFRGAGQGRKALIAELIGGELARTIGLKVPEIVLMHLDDSFSKTEPDEEIQDLLKFSVGLNLGLHFISGAITYDPLVPKVDSLTASKTVLLDSMIINIDRTAKNTNLLNWNNELWLIDHGASLYFHHNWDNWKDYPERPFINIKEHVMLEKADRLEEAAEAIQNSVSEEVITSIVDAVPEDWLTEESNPFPPDEIRAAYRAFLCSKLKNIVSIAKYAADAR